MKHLQIKHLKNSGLYILLLFSLVACRNNKAIMCGIAGTNYISDTIFTDCKYYYVNVLKSKKQKTLITTYLFDSTGCDTNLYVSKKCFYRKSGYILDTMRFINADFNINPYHFSGLFKKVKPDVFYKLNQVKIDGQYYDWYFKYTADSMLPYIDGGKYETTVNLFNFYTFRNTDMPYQLKKIRITIDDIEYKGGYQYYKDNAIAFEERKSFFKQIKSADFVYKMKRKVVYTHAPLYKNLIEWLF